MKCSRRTPRTSSEPMSRRAASDRSPEGYRHHAADSE